MLREENVNIHGPDGVIPGFLVMPAGERRGHAKAILLVQEAFGVNQWMREAARRFAHEGYLVLVPEFFHRQGSGLDIPYDDTERFMAAMAQLTNDGMARDFAASFEFLRERFSADLHEVAVIGYCLGGYGAMLAATRFPIATAISYYGGGMVNERPNFGLKPVAGDFKDIECPVLLFYGAQDAHIGADQRDAVAKELTRQHKTFELIAYEGAGHGFANSDRPSNFSERAAKEAWAKTFDWLAKLENRTLRAAG
ncbi:MAG: dienelactone hydrolase family protein [Alphaproteobacteria bacterium]